MEEEEEEKRWKVKDENQCGFTTTHLGFFFLLHTPCKSELTQCVLRLNVWAVSLELFKDPDSGLVLQGSHLRCGPQ